MSILAPEIIWGLFPRLLGIVFCIAIGSLYGQILPFAGKAGLRPVRLHLEKIREDYPSWRRFLYFPTLFWFNSSDWFLRAVILLGVVAGALAVIGGPFSPLCLLICWIVYLSLDMAFGLFFPWDILLVEAGFLALFLPPVLPLPQIAAETLPLPMVVFAYQFLIFRVMFGFGKFKFLGSNLEERLYLKAFLINQPMPSRLGWLAAHLPKWIWVVALLYLFVVEMIFPFFIFVGGDLRVLAALGIIGLMIGIQLMGNFGFFNLIVICLSITLFDTQLSLLGQLQAMGGTAFTSWQTLLISALLLLWTLGALLYLPFDSWCSNAWVYWPSLVFAKPLWLRRLIDALRAIAPLRLFNAYGVFPPTSSPAVKWVPVFEGSHDGKVWQSYAYRFMPTQPNSPPRFVAPHHPRLDHALFYEALGTSLDNFLVSVFTMGDPYNFTRVSLVDSLMQHLLEGNPQIMPLFGNNPFATGAPKWVRVNCYLLAPTTIAEWRRTGNWWRRQWVGVHTPAKSLAECEAHRYLDPEFFHWDEIVWKRRSSRLQALMASDLATVEAHYDPAEVENFWNDFTSEVRLAQSDWSRLSSLLTTVRARYTVRQLQSFERLVAQLSLLLYVRLEPHALGEAEPSLEFESFFQIGLIAQSVIMEGREAYAALLHNPGKELPLVKPVSTTNGLFYVALFWHDKLAFHARKFRLIRQFNTLSYIPVLPGFVAAIPFLAEQLCSADEEHVPVFVRRIDDGEWLIGEETWGSSPDSPTQPASKMAQ